MDGHSGHTSTTILILHPEPLVGVMQEELLSEAGAGKTLYVTTENQAAEFLATEAVDGAVLGINTNNNEILGVAARLCAADIPFVISGALWELPHTHGLNEAPVLSALAQADEIAAALASVGVNISSQGGRR